MSSFDLASSCVLVVLALGAVAGFAMHPSTRLRGAGGARGAESVVPVGRALLVHVVGPIADALVDAGVAASTVTAWALALAVPAAIAAAAGHFGVAALILVVSSLADGVDGMIARRTNTASPAGALFDAAVDRYGEVLFLGGVAVALRAETCALVLALLAVLGGFMISYGSAKAEALRVEVPGGPMRRGERAAWILAGSALTPPWAALAARGLVPAWSAHAPLVVALAAVAVVGNVSAAIRLRAIGLAASPPPRVHAEAHDRESVPAE